MSTLTKNITLSALIVGLLSGALSSGLLQLHTALDFPWVVGRFGIHSTLALSAGLAFAIVSAVFLKSRSSVPTNARCLGALASIVGMFLAFETAFWASELTDDNFVLAYIAASLVGAGVLSASFVFSARVKDALRVILHCVLWPTLWAALVAFTLPIDQPEHTLIWPNDMILFCGWQAAFLAAITRCFSKNSAPS